MEEKTSCSQFLFVFNFLARKVRTENRNFEIEMRQQARSQWENKVINKWNEMQHDHTYERMWRWWYVRPLRMYSIRFISSALNHLYITLVLHVLNSLFSVYFVRQYSSRSFSLCARTYLSSVRWICTASVMWWIKLQIGWERPFSRVCLCVSPVDVIPRIIFV